MTRLTGSWSRLSKGCWGDTYTDEQQRLHTPRLRDGGLAVPLAKATASVLTLHDIASILGVSTWEEFQAGGPLIHRALLQIEGDVCVRGGLDDGPFGWAGCSVQVKTNGAVL